MSTLVLYLGIFILILLGLEFIPGIRLIGAPLISGAAKLFGTFFGGMAAWAAWIVKTLIFDHMELLRHLFSRREDIDPSEHYR